MPFRKTVFHQNGYYHIFNRGVEKRTIFIEEVDYCVFTDIMRYYLKPGKKDRERPVLSERTGLSKLGAFENRVILLCYSLMPNHFHLILKQLDQNKGISEFIRCSGTAYAMYFNQKYERVGSLFQGRFKAREIDRDEDLLHLSRYIHINPPEAGIVESPEEYPWSSYPVYLGRKYDSLVNAKTILELLPDPKITEYQKFTEAQITKDDKLRISYLIVD